MKKLKMMEDLIGLVNLIKNVKNWYEVLFDYLRFYIGFANDGEMILTFRNGIKLKATRKSPEEVGDIGLIADIYFFKTYNPPSFEIENGYTIIDIGAHKGYFSVFATFQAEDLHVYSFEPFPNTFNFLIENIAMNNLKNISAFNFGICGEKGKRKMYISKSAGTHSMYDTTRKNAIEINCITLEDVFIMNKIEKCDFLKMDCEGAEYEILFNASEDTIKKISKISLEHHEVPQHNYKDLERFFKEKGFKSKSTSKSIYAKR